MKKLLSGLAVCFLAGSLFLSACSSSGTLEGGAGGIESSGNNNDQGGDSGNSGGGNGNNGGNSGGNNDQGAGGNSGGGNESGNSGGGNSGNAQGNDGITGGLGNSTAIEFYLPTLTVIISNDGASYTTGLSTPPIGKAEYQVTAPRKMEVNSERVVELILVPDTLSLQKDKLFQEVEADLIQAFQGQVDVYPQMTAEIVTGTTFSVYPYTSAVKLINEDKSTTWLWYLTALETGTQKLAVILSAPVLAGDAVQNYEFVNLEFEIEVFSPLSNASAPTSTFLPPPPTESPSEPLETTTPENAVEPASQADALGSTSSTDAIETTAPEDAPDLASIPENKSAEDNGQASAELIGLISALITLIVTVIPIYQKFRKKKKR